MTVQMQFVCLMWHQDILFSVLKMLTTAFDKYFAFYGINVSVGAVLDRWVGEGRSVNLPNASGIGVWTVGM